MALLRVISGICLLAAGTGLLGLQALESLAERRRNRRLKKKRAEEKEQIKKKLLEDIEDALWLLGESQQDMARKKGPGWSTRDRNLAAKRVSGAEAQLQALVDHLEPSDPGASSWAGFSTMRRMTPEQMSRIQQQMGNISPEMMQTAMKQMGSMSNSDWDQMADRMNSVDPSAFTDVPGNVGSQFHAQQDYLYKGSLQLKEEGNKLFKSGSFSPAIEKYVRAKANVRNITRPDMQSLKRTCCLNLANCYLKLANYDSCVQECSEVLQEDEKNVKALYRRGQAYHGLNQLQKAELDLKTALALSSDDRQQADMIQGKLKDVQAQIADCDAVVEDIPVNPDANKNVSHEGPVIEEITSDGECTKENSQSGGKKVEGDAPSVAANLQSMDQTREAASVPFDNPELLKDMVKENPGMLKDAANMMSKMSDDDLVSIGKNSGLDVSPDMVRAAQAAMSDMDLGTLKQMAGMAGMMGKKRGDRVFDTSPAPHRVSSPQNLDADMASIAERFQNDPDSMRQQAEMLARIPQDELDRMAQDAGAPPEVRLTQEMAREAASSLASMDSEEIKSLAKVAAHMSAARQSQNAGASEAASTSDVPDAPSESSGNMFSPEMMKAASEIMSTLSHDDISKMSQMAGSMRSGGNVGGLSDLPNNLPNNPDMLRSMFKAMRSMDDESMATMIVSSGMCADHSQAKDMAQKMKSMSDGQADLMIKAASVLQSGATAMKKTKQFLMGKIWLVMALVMVVVGILLRYLDWM